MRKGTKYCMVWKSQDLEQSNLKSLGQTLPGNQIYLASRRHTQGRHPYLYTEWGLSFTVCQSLSKTQGHTLEKSHMCAGTVGEDLPGSQTLSHTRGHTQGRSLMCVRIVDEALLGNQISSHISKHTQESSLMCVRNVDRALA